MSRIHYTQCPVCDSNRIDPLLTVKDHSVSKEEFVIWQCADCTLRFTQDVPDEDSIGPYYKSQEYISHSNTSKGALAQLYQRVRTFTLHQKRRLIERYTRPRGRLLDVGAGTGAFVSTMKGAGWKVTGLEPDEGARVNAKKDFGVQLEEPSQLYQLRDRNFDAITLWHVLEHVHQLHACMERMKELVAKDGKLFIAVPNYTSTDAGAYRNYWAAYDVPRHLYHFTPKAIETLAGRHGLALVAKKPMWFDAFYISLLSSKYHRGHTSWLGAAWTGLRSNLSALANHDRCSSLIYVLEKGAT